MLYERIEQVVFHTCDSWRVWLGFAVAVLLLDLRYNRRDSTEVGDVVGLAHVERNPFVAFVSITSSPEMN